LIFLKVSGIDRVLLLAARLDTMRWAADSTTICRLCPNTIGLMIIAIVFSGVLFLARWLFPETSFAADFATTILEKISFGDLLLDVMLGFLLFAGAMHTSFDQLKVQRWPVLVFATVGVLVSTFLVGFLVWWIFGMLGFQLQFMHCLLFGALISPTDPIAVLGILKQAGVPKKLETKIVGESLFNDGVGVVVFATIFSIATGGGHPGQHATQSHVQPPAIVQVSYENDLKGLEGLAFGWVTFTLLRLIDNYEVEVMITLACVFGGCAIAQWLHVSAPLAMVVAGLYVGNDTVRGTSMSQQTELYVDKFWELVDILLNAILFVLIGFEMLLIDFQQSFLLAGLIAIVIVLASRFFSLLLPVRGLRGGISIALALAMPGEDKALFLTVTYAVVVFSIVIQGLTVGPLARKLIGIDSLPDDDDGH